MTKLPESRSQPLDSRQVGEIIEECGGSRITLATRLGKLRRAVEALYFSAYWHPDRKVDEAALWTAVRDAAGIVPGQTASMLGPDLSKLSEIEKPYCYFDTNEKKVYPTKAAAELMGCIESELLPLYRQGEAE